MPAAVVRVGEWVARGFRIYKQNFVLLAATHFVAAMLGLVTLGVLAGPMLAGLYMICLRLVDESLPRPEVGDLFHGFRHFLHPLLFVVVWWGFALAMATGLVNVLVGRTPLVAAVANAFVLASLEALTLFGIPLIVDRGLPFWPASRESFSHVASAFGGFVVLAFVSRLLSTSGLLLYGFGVFLTLPLHTCVVAVAYRAAIAPVEDGAQVSRPPAIHA